MGLITRSAVSLGRHYLWRQGTLKLSVNSYDFIPQGNGSKLHGEAVIELDKYPKDAEDQKNWALELHVASAIRGHMRDMLKAIDERTKPVADIEQGHISSASCILANLSQKLGRSLKFDSATHTVVGDDEATKTPQAQVSRSMATSSRLVLGMLVTSIACLAMARADEVYVAAKLFDGVLIVSTCDELSPQQSELLAAEFQSQPAPGRLFILANNQAEPGGSLKELQKLKWTAEPHATLSLMISWFATQ